MGSFKEKREQRERLKKNQQVGASLEVVFKEMFSGLGDSIRIVRDPIGSDYMIESDWIEDGNEKLVEITTKSSKILVELKSAFTDTVSMSRKQGERAANESSTFALCVVPLIELHATPEYVREHARFVTDIGLRLKSKVKNVETYNQLKNDVATADGEIQVSVDGPEVQYRVKQVVWANGISFEDFLVVLRLPPSGRRQKF